MRIDKLSIKNFKGFTKRDFHFAPSFNLLIGANGTGKTSALDALAVMMGSWFLGIKGQENRHIRADEIRLAPRKYDGEIRFEEQYSVEVHAEGEVLGKSLKWDRKLSSKKGRTTTGGAARLKKLAVQADDAVRQGDDTLTLPLITYYGTGRLWLEPRQNTQVKSSEKLENQRNLSRLEGYSSSIDPRLSVKDLVRWIARQSWIEYQQGRKLPVFQAVKSALTECVEDAENIYFDPQRGEVIVVMAEHGAQPFINLSDGQRCMLAMVGDIAQKAAKLNPHFGESVLKETPGIVLIDELDLHLHPKWQRRVIEDLRRTFPKIQFIATTHSPFLVQTLREGELIMLDGAPTTGYAGRGVEEVVRYIMGVEMPETSPRFAEMKDVAKKYFEILEKGKDADEKQKHALKNKLEAMTAPYADNPAYVAFLEQKRLAAGIE